MLFVPPAPSPGLSSTEVVAPHRNPFQFVEKPNILDRDRILVPSGWDSWGKIAVLRDGFDAKSWSEAWDRDVEGDGGTGAKLMYAELVPDRGVKVRFGRKSQGYAAGLTNAHVSCSLRHYRLSTSLSQNKRSSRRTTTKTPRSRIAILAAHSATRARPLLERVQALLDQWVVAASVCRTLSGHSWRWKVGSDWDRALEGMHGNREE
jgi:hypothetical protein